MKKAWVLGGIALLSMPLWTGTVTAFAATTPSTIYVSTQSGHNSGTGSQASPYKTITYAIQQAASGSTIVVEAGTYNESLDITKALHIQGEGTVILNEKWESEGIVIHGMKAAGTTVSGLTVENSADHGIYVQDTNKVVLQDNTVTGAIRSGASISEDKPIEMIGVSNSVLSNNFVQNNNSDGGIGISDDGPFNPGALNPGQALPAANNIVKDNIVENNANGCGIVISAYNAGEGVLHNKVSGNTVTGAVAGVVVAAVLPNTAAIDNTVEGNTAKNNGLPGVIVHSNTPGDVVTGTWVLNNTLVNNGFYHSGEMGGVMEGIAIIGNVTPPTHTVIANNTISMEGVGIGYTANAKSSTVIARSNRFYKIFGSNTEQVQLKLV